MDLDEIKNMGREMVSLLGLEKSPVGVKFIEKK